MPYGGPPRIWETERHLTNIESVILGLDILEYARPHDHEQAVEMRSYFINRLNEHSQKLREALFPNGQPERELMQ
jgi:hypothetical protein